MVILPSSPDTSLMMVWSCITTRDSVTRVTRVTRGPGYHLADERVSAAEHGAEQEEGCLAPPPAAPVDDEGSAPGGDLEQGR